MKRYVTGALVALAASAAAAALLAPTATAAVATPAAKLACKATVSNTKPKDHTTTYVTVSTAKGASVATVAQFKTTSRAHDGKADAKGNAKIGYAVSSATPGYPVKVNVTVTSGKSQSTCSASFTPQK